MEGFEEKVIANMHKFIYTKIIQDVFDETRTSVKCVRNGWFYGVSGCSLGTSVESVFVFVCNG